MNIEILVSLIGDALKMRCRKEGVEFIEVEINTDLENKISEIIAYVIDVKTPEEKINMALDFIKTKATDGEKISLIGIYPIWTEAKAYAVGDELQYFGTLYKVIQAHTSQADWQPDKVPALFKVIQPEGVIPQWVQPTGAHDAYAVGAKVLFNGKTYESLISANAYSPEAYLAGWKLIE